VDGRLARRARSPPPQGVRLKKGSSPRTVTTTKKGPGKKSPGLGSVADLCAAWAEAKKGTGRHTAPARDLTAIAGHLDPRQLTPLHFESIVARWKTKYRPATVHSNAAGLRQLARFIEATTAIHGPATWIPKTRDPGPRTTIATPEELRRLEAAAPAWFRCLLVLARSLALRLSECLRASQANLNREKQSLTILVKGGKLHTLPVTPQVLELFDLAPPGDANTPLVERYKGRPATIHAAHHAWRSLKKKTGVRPELIIHDLRRTTAVALYELTHDLRAVEHLLGHSNLATTGRYLEHHDPATLRAVLAEMWTPKTEVKQ